MAGEGAAGAELAGKIGGALKGAGSSAGPAAKAAGAKLVSGLGGAAGSLGNLGGLGGAGKVAGATGSVGKGLLFGGGFFSSKALIDAGGMGGTWLFIAGILYYIGKVVGLNSGFLVFLATFLLFFYSYILFKGHKGGWIIVISFYIWGILLGFKGIVPFDKTYLIYVASVIFGITAIFGIISKGQTLADEAIGLIPIIVFFLEIGAVTAIADDFFNLTPLLKSMVLFMPWFAFAGLFSTKGNNIFLNILKFIGIFYMVSILTIGLVPDLGFSSSEIFNPEEFLDTERDLRLNEDDRPNPALVQLRCTLKMFQKIGETYSIEQCVQEEMLEYEIKAKCTDDTGVLDSNCVTSERQRLEAEGQTISGTIDRDIVEETSAEFIIDSDTFPKEVTRKVGQMVQYPLTLDLKNPHELDLKVRVGCKFPAIDSNNRDFELEGVIIPEGKEVIETNKKDEVISRICKAPEGWELNGSSKIQFYAEFEGLKTESYLTRMFVEQYDEDNQLLKEAKNEFVSGSSKHSGSADEFARINFAFGEPETNPIIEEDDTVILISALENLKNGKITKVDNYKLELDPDFIVSDGEYNCISGGESDVTLPDDMRDGDKIPLGLCFLEMSDEIKSKLDDADFLLNTYNAYLDYDYRIEKVQNIKVNLLT